MHHPTDRSAHTTAFATPVVEHWLEREISTEESGEESTDLSIHEAEDECNKETLKHKQHVKILVCYAILHRQSNRD